ncbi:MAG: protein-S-isoprenylcysteine O-methyltransferase Ste14 [Oleiphilaceae bacterium]|jgi:protein-S-isoprenylcysteine O-methyltransferase Ste14
MTNETSGSFRNNLPKYMMLAAIIGLTVLATLKLQHWTGLMFILGVLMAGSYLVWLLSESDVSATEDSKGDTSKDKGTCELYAFGRFLTVLVAMGTVTHWQEMSLITWLGLALFIFGVLFRLKAISTLGRFYSHRVRLVGEHRIINTGPYQYVRHPAYTGMLTAHFGFVLFFFNPWAMAAFLFVLLPAVVMRIKVEEVALYELEGYSAYAETHKRIFPLVW